MVLGMSPMVPDMSLTKPEDCLKTRKLREQKREKALETASQVKNTLMNLKLKIKILIKYYLFFLRLN